MAVRNDFLVVEICKSHLNPESNPVVGIIRDGELANLICIFDKFAATSRGLEVGKFAKAQVLHVLPRSMVIKFVEYVPAPFLSSEIKPAD